MQSGDLRTKILIQSPVEDKKGGLTNINYVNLCEVYAQWINVHGSEAWVASSVNAVLGATVTIRYRSDITHKCRVVFNGINYEIVSLDNIRQRNQWLEIKLKAVIN